jgi:hypothetical protein
MLFRVQLDLDRWRMEKKVCEYLLGVGLWCCSHDSLFFGRKLVMLSLESSRRIYIAAELKAAMPKLYYVSTRDRHLGRLAFVKYT